MRYINNKTVNACKINLFEGEDNKFVSEKKPTRKIRNKIDLDIKSKDPRNISDNTIITTPPDNGTACLDEYSLCCEYLMSNKSPFFFKKKFNIKEASNVNKTISSFNIRLF